MGLTLVTTPIPLTTPLNSQPQKHHPNGLSWGCPALAHPWCQLHPFSDIQDPDTRNTTSRHPKVQSGHKTPLRPPPGPAWLQAGSANYTPHPSDSIFFNRSRSVGPGASALWLRNSFSSPGPLVLTKGLGGTCAWEPELGHVSICFSQGHGRKLRLVEVRTEVNGISRSGRLNWLTHDDHRVSSLTFHSSPEPLDRGSCPPPAWVFTNPSGPNRNNL